MLRSAAVVAGGRTDRRYHPLSAIYTRTGLEPIARRLADRKMKVKDLFNVNTPHELAELHGYDKP